MSFDGTTKEFELSKKEEEKEFYDLLNSQKINEIILDYYTQDPYCSIYICIRHSSTLDSFIWIRGKERAWVNDMHKEIEETIKTWNGHKRIAYACSEANSLLTISAMIIDATLILLLYPFMSKMLSYFTPTANIIAIFIASFSAIPLTVYTSDAIGKLFPTVEIQTGPEHLQSEKIKRRAFIQLFFTVGIPVLLFILSYVVP